MIHQFRSFPVPVIVPLHVEIVSIIQVLVKTAIQVLDILALLSVLVFANFVEMAYKIHFKLVIDLILHMMSLLMGPVIWNVKAPVVMVKSKSSMANNANLQIQKDAVVFV